QRGPPRVRPASGCVGGRGVGLLSRSTADRGNHEQRPPGPGSGSSCGCLGSERSSRSSLSFCGTTTVLPSIQVGCPTPWYGRLATTVLLANSYTVNVSRIHAPMYRASGDSQPNDGCTGTPQFTLDARRPADGSSDARHGCRSAPTATAPRSDPPAGVAPNTPYTSLLNVGEYPPRLGSHTSNPS